MAILTLTCPACQKLFSFTTHPAFDTGEDASIAEKVRTGEVFVGACPHCGHAEHYSYSFLYKERESHALLYYADNEEDFRKACAIMTGRDPSVPWAGIADWSRRVVANRQVLLEKLLLLDLHLDDRVIEIMKVLAHSFLQKQKPGLLVEPSLRPEKAILGLRKALGLYVNLRPVKIQDSMIEYSPLKPEIAKGTDIMIVRELVGGIYFGDRCESEIHNGAERAWDLENYSVPEVDRITRFAMEAARKRHGHVTSVDKSNVLATSRLWRRTVIKIHDEDYPDVQLDHMYVDNCAQQFAIHPSFFDVVVTGNLFGDILSDEAAVLSGSIGMLPSASIGNETSLYEPIHGSAPDNAGKGIANPIATILSAAMLLRYSLNEDKAADAIEAAVNQALDDGYRTGDIYKEGMKKVNGRGMTDAILARIQ